MQGNRRRDTQPELAVRSRVHRLGLRYRVDRRPIREVSRSADLVFPSEHLAVFIDGCFWHGCEKHFVMPSTNVGYWSEKIGGNRTRDIETDRLLADHGWRSLRYWEHEDASDVALDIYERVRGAVPR